MKTSYFLVVLLALTLLPGDVDGWFFRSARRIRVNVYHQVGCMAACRWARSWACKVCKRKRGLDVDTTEDQDAEVNSGFNWGGVGLGVGVWENRYRSFL